MPNFYTVVGVDNMVKLSNITNDPGYPILDGERLLLDNPPSYTQLQKVIRVEPVPPNVLEMVYTVVDDTQAIAASVQSARKVSPLQFIERFTDAEQLAIVTVTQTNPQVKLWYDKLLASKEVNFDDARTQAGMSALVAAGLITQERSVIILPPYIV
jgi:hypothetical protein